MKPISQILIAPVITEMTSGFMLDEKSGAYKYAFKVNPSANKQEIRQAVEAKFGVHVLSVRTANMKGGLRTIRGTRRQKTESTWKRAIVTVKAGERIETL